jgi:hypothetical protein
MVKSQILNYLFRFRGECPAACGVLFFAQKVGGVKDTETKSLLSEHNTPQLCSKLDPQNF